MMKALLSIRFRALFAGLTAQARQKKKRGTGTVILFAVLYLYLGAVILGVMGMTFYSLAQPYHTAGLDWLYFAMSGLMGLGFAVIGSVFTTQSQLYDAKDNPMLLSMPISPGAILFSRMLPLLALNLLFAGIVMVPAMVVYILFISFNPVWLLFQLLSLLAVTVLAQAIACLLGWLLHLLLSKLNKSFASMLYLVVFLAVYFSVYSQASQILNSMVTGSQALAGTLRSWVWPIYAMGMGCTGKPLLLLAFLGICAAVFSAVYWVLSATFLKTATIPSAGKKRRRLDLKNSAVTSPCEAVIKKELRKFLGTPVYLTNMGMGLLMTVAMTVAAVIFREDIAAILTLLQIGPSMTALVICAFLSFLISTLCISTPSVSLEGKNIWILKSMPIASRDILTAKLSFHCRLSIPTVAASGLILAVLFGCSWLDTAACVLLCSLLALLCGLIGMAAGLNWARLDYISEAYPCKQSVSVAVTMFGMMGVPLVLGLVYGLLLWEFLSPTAFMLLSSVLLAGVCYWLYRLMVTWGVQKWNSL